jgi:hypothetical protein
MAWPRGFVVFAFGVMLPSRWTRSERVRVGVGAGVGVRCRAQYGTGKRGAVAVQVRLKGTQRPKS